jgi:hypothetical protein
LVSKGIGGLFCYYEEEIVSSMAEMNAVRVAKFPEHVAVIVGKAWPPSPLRWNSGGAKFIPCMNAAAFFRGFGKPPQYYQPRWLRLLSVQAANREAGINT